MVSPLFTELLCAADRGRASGNIPPLGAWCSAAGARDLQPGKDRPWPAAHQHAALQLLDVSNVVKRTAVA